MKKIIILSAVLVASSMLPTVGMAGNVKKVYINISKEGNQAQASDIPANYGQSEGKFSNLAYDAKGNHGLLYNTTVVDGPEGFGRALDFNITKANAEAKFNAGTLNITGPITTEMWIKAKTGVGNNNAYLNKEDQYEVGIWDNNQVWAAFYTPSGWRSVSANAFVSDNKWTHVVVSYGLTNIRYYINGELKDTKQNAPGIGPMVSRVDSPLRFGGRGYSSLYLPQKVNLDDIRIWNRVLSDAEIKKNYNKPLTGGEAGLVGYWNFEGNQ